MLLARPGLVAGQRSGRPELADIFRSHGQSYQRTHRLSASQQKVMRAVSVCALKSWEVISSSATLAALSTRLITPAVTATALNASRWPKPSGWKKQTSELLPVGYFHLVFALPHDLTG
jgi:hypothetical protein